MARIDWRAVMFGAGAALALAGPAALIGAVLIDDDSNNGVFVFYVVIFAGMLAGGFVAGSKRPDTPMTHGAIAAATAYLVAQAMAVLVRFNFKSPAVYVFNALLAASIGAVGGLVAERRNTRIGST
jgi:hypothetical protein